ncbi:hypothetical protein AC578_6487 [Pseudocercospora eumusae]|uniref:Uncharacterized protein n=1 Tax=Pseudocercospora eumusae TaxID=321146 RepID=A0A139HD06_9PEZI|nr:hypothetical protein AC578_6487 [Pseudocercospora eumusae]
MSTFHASPQPLLPFFGTKANSSLWPYSNALRSWRRRGCRSRWIDGVEESNTVLLVTCPARETLLTIVV